MKLYHAPKAINPDRVTCFLRAKSKLDAVDLVEVSIMKQEHKTPEYKAMSPYAQVPVLTLDDGTNITESRAICTYLEGVFPEPNLLGSDPKEKALIEMWERRLDFQYMMQFATWFRNSHEMMAPLENPQVPEAAAKAEGNVKWFAEKLDDHLADNEFVTAGRFSNADIFLYLCLGFSRVMGWKPDQDLEHLGRFRAAMKERGFAG